MCTQYTMDRCSELESGTRYACGREHDKRVEVRSSLIG